MLKRTAFLFVVAALLPPASAAASTTVAHDGTTTRITGDAEADDVRVSFAFVDGPGPVNGDAVRVSNPAGAVPGPGCGPEAGGTVLCPLGEEIAAARVIRVKLNKRGRRLVRARRSVRTQVFVAHQDPAARRIRIATVGLRRARR